MSGILTSEIEKYTNSLLPARDAVLREMERHAAKHNIPIVGPACARVLSGLCEGLAAGCGRRIGVTMRASTTGGPPFIWSIG